MSSRALLAPEPVASPVRGDVADLSRLMLHHGLRVTTARLHVLQVLADRDGIDFHDICRELQKRSVQLPASSVQRVLNDLSARGVVTRDDPAGTPGVCFTLSRRPADAGTVPRQVPRPMRG